MKQRIPAVILMFALFLSTSFAANAYKKSIEVEYGIDVEFNGQQIAMADATGKPVDAFVYQGTTYVPIRAISETFGADVGYDSSTNTAYVYDDFSEICAVVNAMSYISSSCYNTILLQMATMGADTASDMSAELNTIDEQVDNMYDTLSFLTTEDGYNVNISIITEDILPSYGTFLLSYRDTLPSILRISKTQIPPTGMRFSILCINPLTIITRAKNLLWIFTRNTASGVT